MNNGNDGNDTTGDQFFTPPAQAQPDFEEDTPELVHDSSDLELNLLDNTAEEFEDGEITPCLTLAGSTAPVTADVRRHSTEKAMLEATLTNLRSKLSDLEKDDWLYEGPRYTCS